MDGAAGLRSPGRPSGESAIAPTLDAHARQTTPPAPSRKAGERPLGPALGTAAEVGKVTGEPEQLELERESDRVELGAVRRPALEHVEEVEEAGQREERPLVALLLGEEAKHRLGADEADREPVRVFAHRGVRADEVGSRDRGELTPADVEHQLDV